jgi:hypothetical protein
VATNACSVTRSLKLTSTSVSTWMGDRQGKLCAVNLYPFVGVDVNLPPEVEPGSSRLKGNDRNHSAAQTDYHYRMVTSVHLSFFLMLCYVYLGIRSSGGISAKLVEIKHQVLFLTKLVQRGFAGQAGQSAARDGPCRLPDNVFLPLNSLRDVTNLETLLTQQDVHQKLVTY